jgi:1-acyl-sn-glycerol-3-phosphate acyltransferase
MHAERHDARPKRRKRGAHGLADRPFQRMGPVKSVAGALAATGALLPPAFAWRLMKGDAGRMPQMWHQAVSRAMGVRSRLLGEPATGSVLYVVNHLSWLDIPVIGAHLSASFVAKAEVGSMGLVGFLADIQQTIYVERERRTQAPAQANEIRSRLVDGDNIILFPEGTSNDGVRILPFKSSLFAVVEGEGTEAVRIQPLTLAYTHLNGLPLTRNRLIELAWIGDMELGSHAFDCMRLGRIDARILCHAPVRRADFADRKALARHCQAEIVRGYARLIRGGL